MTSTVDPARAVAWRASVESTVRAAAAKAAVDADAILADARFVEGLDGAVELDPGSTELDAAAREAVSVYLRTTEASGVHAAGHDTHEGRVLESRGVDATGGRVYRVQIIRYGDSRNGRRYTEAVMRRDACRYEGARAYDRHRSADELRSSTIAGLVGQYRDVQTTAAGLEADLHLLPGASHAAEALDASIAAQAAGRPPLVGLSHDVLADFRQVHAGGRRVMEAVRIAAVNSVDLVADPAAGGAAVRALAGGTTTEQEEDGDMPTTTESVLAALQQATPEQLAAAGLARASEATTTEAVSKTGFVGRAMIREAVAAAVPAGATDAVVTAVTAALPERITEADVTTQITAYQAMLAPLEAAGLTPTVTTTVVQEAHEKKVERLDKFFAGDFADGYHSLRHAYMDITGYRPDYAYTEDVNRRILRESYGGGYDSTVRTTESLTTASWAQVLGDSITRRMVASYRVPSLQTWRRVVSSIVPVDDFRTQRVGRVGGYGVLPTVNEGQPYQPLTSPGDEESTYALAKKGGTEDVTLEQIANDDRRAISKIPTKLGRAAAQTLYRFVFDFFTANAATTYDSVAWFHASHGNTAAAALSQSALSAASLALMTQTAYGDSYEVLGEPAKLLIVPAALRELAFQLTRSAVAVPATPAGPSDTPNIHSQLDAIEPIVVPYWSDANDWFALADPAAVPTIEVGFYQGRQEPELFTQADSNVGSVFNADVFTYKERFIFSGTVLDHRGAYRGTQ